MQFITSLLLLLVPALVMATDGDRGLQIADWHVTILTMEDHGFTFETGAGGGGNANIKVTVTDVCRKDSATRVNVGQFYPTSNVVGIDADGGGIVNNPGAGNSLDWTFVEGINGNADIYTDNMDQTATVEFCVMVGLYDVATLIDYAEVKVTYSIDLVTNIPSLTGYSVTQAEAFTDAADTAVSFDGTLLAYFCNPTTKNILTDDGTKTHQGSILNVCFKVASGSFEVANVMEFTVKNALAAQPSQLIVTGSQVASAIYATKDCTDTSNTDTNVCVVSFLLKAEFYDFAALTLTGTGSVLLEFGDAGARRMLRKSLKIIDGRNLKDAVTEDFTVEAHEFQVDQVAAAGSSANSAMTSLAAFGAIAAAALAM
jgi:hypothetical protein